MNELIREILENALWPMIVLTVILMFRDQVSTLISNMKALKSGSIEVVFDQRVKNIGLPKSNLEELKQLTREEVSLFFLLSFSDDPEFTFKPGLNKETFNRRMEALESAGLIYIETIEHRPNTKLHLLTPAGKRVKDILLDTTTRLFQENA